MVLSYSKRANVLDIFTRFKFLIENRFQNRIVTLYTDNGGKYIALFNFLSSHGITHLTTPPHIPEHNGFYERRHRHIVETGLALLSHVAIPTIYWPYAFVAAIYLINRMPTSTLSDLSPYKSLFGFAPNVHQITSFQLFMLSMA